jgi:hypothetical protein
MSIVRSILENSKSDSEKSIHAQLQSRGAFLIRESCKQADVVANIRLTEMRDSPDQSRYAISRRDVERMLSKYERREDDSTGFDNPEPRSIEGAKRARWYAPEHNSDFVDDLVDGPTGMKPNTDNRPAKLMPYDYEFSVHKPGDIETEPADEISDADTEVENDDDWEGETNKFFSESVESSYVAESQDDASKNVVDLFHDATKHAYPVEFHLDDGSYVTVHPQDAQHFLNSGRAGDVLNHITSASHFQAFLKDVYNKEPGVGHD